MAGPIHSTDPRKSIDSMKVSLRHDSNPLSRIRLPKRRAPAEHLATSSTTNPIHNLPRTRRNSHKNWHQKRELSCQCATFEGVLLRFANFCNAALLLVWLNAIEGQLCSVGQRLAHDISVMMIPPGWSAQPDESHLVT